jgi:hypothetical protein
MAPTGPAPGTGDGRTPCPENLCRPDRPAQEADTRAYTDRLGDRAAMLVEVAV